MWLWSVGGVRDGDEDMVEEFTRTERGLKEWEEKGFEVVGGGVKGRLGADLSEVSEVTLSFWGEGVLVEAYKRDMLARIEEKGRGTEGNVKTKCRFQEEGISRIRVNVTQVETETRR